MRMKQLVAAGPSALLLCLVATASPAQNRSRQRAPVVRVYSQDAGVVSSYVRPVIKVSEDAYVFAVMMDLDGRIQVLHPEFPGISVRIRSNKQLTLPNFFAGYNDPRQSGRYSGVARYDGYGNSDGDTRGTVIAIASRAPFNLDLIDAGGDWNNSVIRRLIEDRTPESAARSLASYLAVKGEPVGHDYMRFAGHRRGYYAYNGYNAYDYCGYSSYSRFGGYYGLPGLGTAAALRAAGVRPLFLGYDSCGIPIVVVSPFARGRFPLPHPQRPPGDTTVFPKSRFPTDGVVRVPGGDNAPLGIFPLPQRGELPQMGDVTNPGPQRRRTEPREERFRPQPGSISLPDRARTPVERIVPRAEPASSEMRPVYRPEPAVAAPSSPVRAPERVYRDPPPRVAPPRMAAPAPAPVVYERPAPPPPPPPPRNQSEPQSKPVPTPRS